MVGGVVSVVATPPEFLSWAKQSGRLLRTRRPREGGDASFPFLYFLTSVGMFYDGQNTEGRGRVGSTAANPAPAGGTSQCGLEHSLDHDRSTYRLTHQDLVRPRCAQTELWSIVCSILGWCDILSDQMPHLYSVTTGCKLSAQLLRDVRKAATPTQARA